MSKHIGDNPVIGTVFGDSKVVNVREEIVESAGRRRKRRILELENGLTIVDESVPIDGVDFAEEVITPDERRRRRKEKLAKDKAAWEEREKARKAAEERRFQEAQKAKAAKDAKKPKNLPVYPLSKKPKKSNTPHGVWDYLGSKPANEDLWDVIEVQMYAPGIEPKSREMKGTHGVWVYNPNGASIGPPKDFLVYPPGEAPPNDGRPRGHWTYKGEYPPAFERPKPKPQTLHVYPRAKEPVKSHKRYGIWSYGGNKPEKDDNFKRQDVLLHAPGFEPKRFDATTQHGVWGFAPGTKDIMVYAPGVKPSFAAEGVWTYEGEWPPASDFGKEVTVYPKAKMPEGTSPPRGVWTYPKGTKAEQDDAWEPVNVVALPPGHQAGSSIGSRPHGIWGYAPGTKPKGDEEFNPKDILVLPPGVKAPSDFRWKTRGIWVMAEDGTWPPPSRIEDRGATASDAEPASKNEPSRKADLRNRHEKSPATKAPLSPPRKDRSMDPDLMKRREQPSTNKAPPSPSKKAPSSQPELGKRPEQKRPEQKSSIAPSSPSRKNRGTTTPPTHESDANLPVVMTYPESQKPRSRLKPRGVWTYPPRSKRINDDMKPQPVMVYPPGQKPGNLGQTGPYGVWSYAPGGKPRASKKFQPKDILVYPENVTPPNGAPDGYWTYPPDSVSPTSYYSVDAMLTEPRALLAVEDFEVLDKPRESFVDLGDWKDAERYKSQRRK